MKKTILIGIISLMLISLVYSLGVGDTLTQQQVDNLNTDNLGLQPSLKSLNYKGDWLIVTFDHLNLEKTDDYYTIARKEGYTRVRREWISKCLTNYEKSKCVEGLRNYIIRAVKSSVENTREEIENFKTQSTETISLSDLGINSQDLE